MRLRLNKSRDMWLTTNAIIPIDDGKVKGRIIGSGGTSLRQINTETGALLMFCGEDGESRLCGVSVSTDMKLHISGQPEQVNAAMQRVQGILMGYREDMERGYKR